VRREQNQAPSPAAAAAAAVARRASERASEGRRRANDARPLARSQKKQTPSKTKQHDSVYTDGDGKAKRQSLLSLSVALITLTIYCGWMHILIGLLLASFFSRWALGTLLLLMATLFLPAKPVLWTAFCASPLFGTWRSYFSYSYLAVSFIFVGVFWCCCCGGFVCRLLSRSRRTDGRPLALATKKKKNALKNPKNKK
jgi:hypothetical protein